MKKDTRLPLMHACEFQQSSKAGWGPWNKATQSNHHSLPQSFVYLNHGNKQCFETACHITLQLSTKLWWGGKREGGEKRREKGRGKRTILKEG